jgi:glycerophosphoryl diester phosphodiesterase
MGAAAWHPNMKHLDEAMALATLQAGFGLNVWTVNTEADMRSLLAWGATGIITDFVERARAVVDSRLPGSGA